MESAVSPAPETEEKRRRRFGFLLFFFALLLIVIAVRAIPADWEIGPFRIDANGNASDPASSLYFADDPRAPFWLLVPTFNLPPRFFAVRPNASRPPVALRPSASGSQNSPAPSGPTPSGSVSPSGGASRSEERRVGKECRGRWAPEQEKK